MTNNVHGLLFGKLTSDEPMLPFRPAPRKPVLRSIPIPWPCTSSMNRNEHRCKQINQPRTNQASTNNHNCRAFRKQANIAEQYRTNYSKCQRNSERKPKCLFVQPYSTFMLFFYPVFDNPYWQRKIL